MNTNEIKYLFKVFETFYDDITNYNLSLDCDIENMIKDIEERDYVVYAGASKVVVIPAITNYVIKTTLDYDSDGASINFDYCAREYENYKDAVKVGIEGLFAKTEYLGTINGHKVYAQERLNLNDYLDTNNYSRSDRGRYSTSYSRSVGICDALAESIICSYGTETYEKFVEFCEYKSINDLHMGNFVGVEGAPVIYDFSGYHGINPKQKFN